MSAQPVKRFSRFHNDWPWRIITRVCMAARLFGNHCIVAIALLGAAGVKVSPWMGVPDFAAPDDIAGESSQRRCDQGRSHANGHGYLSPIVDTTIVRHDRHWTKRTAQEVPHAIRTFPHPCIRPV